MNQRPTAFANFPGQNYAYAQHTYATQQQPQQQAQYPSGVQYPVPPQHTQAAYYPSLPTTAAVAQPPQSVAQARSQTTATPRRNNTVQSNSPTGQHTNASTSASASAAAAAAAETTSPDVTQFDGDVSMSFADAQDDESGDQAEEGPVFRLPPPPENTYASDKDLEKAMHAWSLEHGYELVRRASKKNSKGILYKRYYHCSKQGKIANTGKLTDETRVRVNRKSNRIGCPMSVAVVAVDPTDPGGQWQIRHRKIHHNHGPIEAVSLAGHRRRARMGGVEKAVDSLFAIGTPTAQVLTFLQRTNPNGLFTRTDVANMKLKFKKYGSCIDRRDVDASTESTPRSSFACTYCREKKVKCDAQRPQCTTCVQAGRDCQYVVASESTDMPQQQQPSLSRSESQAVASSSAATTNPRIQQRSGMGSTTGSVQPDSVPPSGHAEAILANLESFQATHVKPKKLTLQSSSVEVLAASSCGNGDSYKTAPNLEKGDHWPTFRDAIADASMKENTFEVLLGMKTAPEKPDDEDNVEEWNEYIKQLAIFNRRNTALLGGLLPKLSAHFRHKVQHIRSAAEVWQVLEDLCQPRGSDKAYKLYLDLHSITLQTCSGVREYITKLESAFAALNRVVSSGNEDRYGNQPEVRSSNTDPTRRSVMNNPPNNVNQWSSVGAQPFSSRLQKNNPKFPEEMLCFLFLRNLGPVFSRWSENACKTGNVGGFGTGRRVGYADLTRSALEWEALQQSHAANSG